jgi:flagellar hook-basal body complex protein FliE
MLKAAVNSVNGQITDADAKVLALSLGDVKDVHEVTLAMEKANLSLQLTLEIRNKIVEAYQSIMRQQI